MNPDQAAGPDGPLWTFALGFYARPGVAPACLALQERLGVDVNVLLLAAFAFARHGTALDGAAIADADGRVSAWRSEVVAALRRVRTTLKTGPAPAPDRWTDDLREGVKALELRAERIALSVLDAWLAGRTTGATDASPDTALDAVISHYAADPAALADPAVQAALRALAAALRPDATSSATTTPT